MLPAANRLRTAADFQEIIRRGARASRGAVVVHVLGPDRRNPAAASTPPRVGTVVSKKVGNSVRRHRAARRIRGAVAPWVGDVPDGTGVVIRALPGADRDPNLAADVHAALMLGVERACRASAEAR
jgi:ribonuclease P protein component